MRQEYVRDDSGITPFWKKFGMFLTVPFHTGPAMLLGLVVLGGVAAGFLGSFALALRGIMVFAAIRFAFQLFDHFSVGRFDVDSPDIVTWPPQDPRAGKQGLIILFYVGMLIGLAGLVGTPVETTPPAPSASVTAQAGDEAMASPHPDEEDALRMGEAGGEGDFQGDGETAEAEASAMIPEEDGLVEGDMMEGQESSGEVKLPLWFWLVALLLAVPLPASAAVLALQDSLIKSLSPAHTLTFLRGMGSAYLILLGLFLTIFLVRFAILELAKDLPLAVAYPLEGLAIAYLTMVLYAMLGYVMYQYHGEFGLDVAVDFETHKEEVRGDLPQDPLERRIRPLVKAGQWDEAIAWVKDEMRYNRFDVPLNQRLHELYLGKGDNTQILAHGQQYLHALVKEGKDKEALHLLHKLEAIDPAFIPENGDTIHPLATAAYLNRLFPKALTLLKGFDRRHPEHPHIPDIYLLGAKLSTDFLHNDLQSIVILKTLLQRYPEAACADEARKFLAALENIARMAGQQAG